MKESWKNIKCPYCFTEFAHDEVHFRIAEEACEDAKNKANKKENQMKRKSFLNF